MKRLIFALIAIAQMLLGPIEATFAAGVTEEDRPAIEAIVKQYLLNHPEIIEQVFAEIEQRQQKAESEARGAQVDALKTKLFESARQINLGNPSGDVTVVEFFDYNCTYCRHALPDMVTMLKGDPKLRFVLKEWPVLGPDSVEAARVAAAVRLVDPKHYQAFHEALLSQKGRVNGAKALALAKDIGMDATAVSAKMGDPEVDATLKESNDLAKALGLNGTPSYVVGNEVVFGAVGGDTLRQKVDNLRQCGKTTC